MGEKSNGTEFQQNAASATKMEGREPGVLGLNAISTHVLPCLFVPEKQKNILSLILSSSPPLAPRLPQLARNTVPRGSSTVCTVLFLSCEYSKRPDRDMMMMCGSIFRMISPDFPSDGSESPTRTRTRRDETIHHPQSFLCCNRSGEML